MMSETGRLNDNWMERVRDTFRSIYFVIMALGLSLFIEYEKINPPDLWGIPFDIRISLWLLVFVIFILMIYHVSEYKLLDYYDKSWDQATPLQKSADKFGELIYLLLFIFLSVSIVHLCLFFIALSCFALLNMVYDGFYWIDQRKRKLDWAKGVFDPASLFFRWMMFEVFRLIAVIYFWMQLVVKGKDFLLYSRYFIVWLFILLVLEFIINFRFYLCYYPKE